tara:strand:+ start:211 stop:1209 length:999 start_codon:yes stop_codon:yes gene_type:complete
MSYWFWSLLGRESSCAEGQEININGADFVMDGGILRSSALVSAAQQQTSDVFGFKWHQRDSFESEASRAMMREWATNRYGNVNKWIDANGAPIILDAGCGAGYTAREYLEAVLGNIRYVGADISAAVNVAKERMAEVAVDAAFIQCDVTKLPFRNGSVDVVFSEGVLHHTDSTENAIKSLAPLLKTGGLFMFYVYKKKGPVREFTDDYIRRLMQEIPPQEGWEKMLPLSKLGKALGELDIEVEIEDPIDLLEIPAGRINIQRLFYWHVFKAFYRPEYSVEEMNHINFDWYAPRNAFRQTPDQVSAWCAEAGLVIEHEKIEDAGITIVARRAG